MKKILQIIFIGILCWYTYTEYGDFKKASLFDVTQVNINVKNLELIDDLAKSVEDFKGKNILDIDKNKIKGTPLFLQNTEFPGSGNWNLLMQLDSTAVPFFVNFGDAGIGYAFLSQDGKKRNFYGNVYKIIKQDNKHLGL